MPRVRIIARLPKYPAKLVRDLRSRGFEVETIVTRDMLGHSSALEISLECCSPEDVAGFLAEVHGKDKPLLIIPREHNGMIGSVKMIIIGAREEAQPAVSTLSKQAVQICEALLCNPDLRAQDARIARASWRMLSRSIRSQLRNIIVLAGQFWRGARNQDRIVWRVLTRGGGALNAVLRESAREATRLARAIHGVTARCIASCRHEWPSHEPLADVVDEFDIESVPSIFNRFPTHIASDRKDRPPASLEHKERSWRFHSISGFAWRRSGVALVGSGIIAGIILISSHTNGAPGGVVNNTFGDANVERDPIQTHVDETPNGPAKEQGDVWDTTRALPKVSRISSSSPVMKTAHIGTLSADPEVVQFSDDVTVRHYTRAGQSLPPPERGIKRRVVID